MNDTTKAPERIWAWAEDCGDVCVNEWAPAGDPDAPYEAYEYILATPAALASSPEVAALIREAEARVMERAADAKITFADRLSASECTLIAECVDAYKDFIRAEAAALRGEKEPK